MFIYNYILNIKNLFKKEWLVFLIAILVGVLYVLPYYTNRLAIGSEYKGMPLLIQDSEGEYLGEIREVTEGHYKIASSVFYEYKDSHVVIPPIGHWIYALPTILFGFDVISVDMAYKFILPVVLFLFLYTFLMEITGGSRFWSIVGASLVVIGFDLTTIFFLKKLLIGDFSGYIAPWTRPINPITGMIGLTLIFYYLYRLFTLESKKFIFPGIFLGLMVGYFFSFVYAGVFCISVIMICVLFGKSNQKIKSLFGVLSVGLLSVIFLMFDTITAFIFQKNSFIFSDPKLHGLFYTHHLLINKTSLVFTFVFIFFTYVFYWWKNQRLWTEDWWQFCIALLFSNQVVFNIQVVLGWTIWPAHFVQYTNQVISLVAVVFLSRVFDQHIKPLARFIGAIIIILLFAILGRTLLDYKFHIPTLEKFQTYAPIMSWLKSNAGNDCVVYVVQDDGSMVLELNRFVSAFTQCDVYNSYHIYQNIPRERVFHNVLVWLWFKGVSLDELPTFLNKNDFWVRAYMFRDWRDMFCCGGDKWVASLGTIDEFESWKKDINIQISNSYLGFLKRDIKQELSKYRLDYIILDKKSRYHKNLDRVLNLVQVYSDSNYIIYKFK